MRAVGDAGPYGTILRGIHNLIEQPFENRDFSLENRKNRKKNIDFLLRE